jgi:hypothetical protein
MKNGGQLPFVLIFFFLATQFISICGTMFVLACPENIGNYEDISPEHIVPLDPFLAGGHQTHVISRSSAHSNNAPLRGLGLLPQFLFQLAALSVATLSTLSRPSRLQLRGYISNLWLRNRVLLI